MDGLQRASSPRPKRVSTPARATVEGKIAVTFGQLLEADAGLENWDGAHPPVDQLGALIESVEANLAEIERRLCKLRAA